MTLGTLVLLLVLIQTMAHEEENENDFGVLEEPVFVNVGVVDPPIISSSKTILATCTARAPYPPAKVLWEVGSLRAKVRTEETTKFTGDRERTNIVTSHLISVPSMDLNRKEVRCFVRHPTLSQVKVINYTLDVHYPPRCVKITLTDDGSGYVCSADANPTPTNYTWKREGQPLLSAGPGVEGNRLFLGFTPDLNGLYNCEATNPYGTTKSDTVTRFVTSEGSGAPISLLVVITITVGAIVFTILWQCFKRNKQEKSLKVLARKLLVVRKLTTIQTIL